MPTLCCCGNKLEPDPSFTVRQAPCKCKAPGPGRRQAAPHGIPDHVFEQQYNERKRLGLPIETDMERGVRRKW